MTGRFAGRVVLVTGASSGIGAATAEAFGAGGAAVAVNHLGASDDAAAVVDRVIDAGGTGLVVEADVADERSVAMMVDTVRGALGPVDVLVNNAGVISRADCVELAEAEWDRVLGVNLKGVFLCCKHVAPDMTSRGRGRIINVSSDLAFTGEAQLVHYCAAKGGVLSLSRALARELAPHGVTVNTVAPGLIETPMLVANPVTYHDGTLVKVPAGRWGGAPEVAAAITFLASDDAAYFVGSVLSPNGGLVMS